MHLLLVALWPRQEVQTASYYWLFSREAGAPPVEVLRGVSCDNQEQGGRRECVHQAWGAPRVRPGEVQFEAQCNSRGAWNKDNGPAAMATKTNGKRKKGGYGDRPGQFPGILSWVIRSFPEQK